MQSWTSFTSAAVRQTCVRSSHISTLRSLYLSIKKARIVVLTALCSPPRFGLGHACEGADACHNTRTHTHTKENSRVYASLCSCWRQQRALTDEVREEKRPIESIQGLFRKEALTRLDRRVEALVLEGLVGLVRQEAPT